MVSEQRFSEQRFSEQKFSGVQALTLLVSAANAGLAELRTNAPLRDDSS